MNAPRMLRLEQAVVNRLRTAAPGGPTRRGLRVAETLAAPAIGEVDQVGENAVLPAHETARSTWCLRLRPESCHWGVWRGP